MLLLVTMVLNTKFFSLSIFSVETKIVDLPGNKFKLRHKIKQ